MSLYYFNHFTPLLVQSPLRDRTYPLVYQNVGPMRPNNRTLAVHRPYLPIKMHHVNFTVDRYQTTFLHIFHYDPSFANIILINMYNLRCFVKDALKR